jgi:hypothetical protein
MKRLLYFPLLALAATALAACGGGGGVPITSFPAPTVTTQALTKTDYITKADAICAEANAALGSLPASDAATLAGQQVDVYQNLVDQLDGLGVPTEDQTTLQQFLSAEKTILENQKSIQLAQQRGDTSGSSQFTSAISAAETEAKTAATSYGFQECGKGAVASPGATAPGAGTSGPPAAPQAPATPPAGTPGGGGTPPAGGGGGNSGGVGAP